MIHTMVECLVFVVLFEKDSRFFGCNRGEVNNVLFIPSGMRFIIENELMFIVRFYLLISIPFSSFPWLDIFIFTMII